MRFACGLLLLGVFILGLLSWFVFKIVWLTISCIVVFFVAGGIFFFLCLED